MLVALLVISCDQGGSRPRLPARTPVSSPVANAGPVIALVGTMTGPGSWRGDDAFEGADLAVHLLNRNRPRGAPRFQLVTYDDHGDKEEATELVERATRLEDIAGVVYAGPPEALAAAEPALATAGIPAMLCYGDLYAARLLTPHVFQMAPSFVWQARRIAHYLIDDRRYQRVALVHESSLMGRVARRALGVEVRRRGRRLMTMSYTHAVPLEAERIMWRLRRWYPEAIVVEGGPNILGPLLRGLDRIGNGYGTTARARRVSRRRLRPDAQPKPRTYKPQIVGFDLGVSPLQPVDAVRDRGTVAAETLARGAHYLPIPSLERFRAAFVDWWDTEPLGWERRAFEAASIVGWAWRRAGDREVDLGRVLETISRRRFGGLDVTFGPDDHTAVNETDVGLWVVPSAAARVRERDELPDALPWVPLSRGFSINGRRTIIDRDDWLHLFADAPPEDAPPPNVKRLKYGVATPRRDRVH